MPVELSVEKNSHFTKKVKEKIASFFDFFLSKAHASSSIPKSLTSKPEELAECKNASHLFPEGFIQNIKDINKTAVIEGINNKKIFSAKKKEFLKSLKI